MQPVQHVARERTVAIQNRVGLPIDTVLSIAAYYRLPSSTVIKKKTIAISTGLLAYTFTKLGDNLTNNNGNILMQTQTWRKIYSFFDKNAERAK